MTFRLLEAPTCWLYLIYEICHICFDRTVGNNGRRWKETGPGKEHKLGIAKSSVSVIFAGFFFFTYNHLAVIHRCIFFKRAVWQLFFCGQPVEGTADHILLYDNQITGHCKHFSHVCCQPVNGCMGESQLRHTTIRTTIISKQDALCHHVLLGTFNQTLYDPSALRKVNSRW